MKKITGLALASVAVLALSGCTGSDSDPLSLVMTSQQAGSETQYDSTLNLMNSSSSYEDICEVLSTPAASVNWSTLSGTPIMPGNAHHWGSDRCGQDWDLKVTDCAGNSKTTRYTRNCYTTTYFTFTSK